MWLVCALVVVAIFSTSGCVNPRARNVAYDPFVPSMPLTRSSEASFRSMTYRGPVGSETVTVQTEYKEVVVPERSY